MKKKCRLRLGLFSAVMLGAAAVSMPRYFPALIGAAAIHETGHILAAHLLKLPMREFKLGLFGASLTPESALFSYTDEIILCLFGPMFNFLSVPAAVCLFKASPFSAFVLSSVLLGTVNLLPISGFDGGRILSAFLSMLLPPRAVVKIIGAASFVFLFSLWCISLYLMIRAGASLPLFVFSASAFAKIFITETT